MFLEAIYQRVAPALSKNRIWAVGGGKGGVGKSLIAANLSVSLALKGHRVVAVDLDLGAANLHTCLGCPAPEKTLSDYLSGSISNISEIMTPTSIKNLFLVSGAQDSLGIANIKKIEKRRILSSLADINADYIILDLSAGTSVDTIDFFIAAHHKILTILPEPTSIENAYRFIKAVQHRKFQQSQNLLGCTALVNHIGEVKPTSNPNPFELIDRLSKTHPEIAHKLRAELTTINFKLVMNQVRSKNDLDIGFNMGMISKKHLGVNLSFTGYINYDALVWQSVKKGRPVLVEYPSANIIDGFESIVSSLLGSET